MLTPFDTLEIGNRTKRPLSVTYDGKTWTLPPFPATVQVPRVIAEAACRQHPRMGTENPYNPQDVELLVYVAGTNQPKTAIEQTASAERLDRGQLPRDRQKTETVSMPYRPVRDGGDSAGIDAVFEGR